MMISKRDSRSEQYKEFENIYDATEVMRAKSSMTKLECADIEENDLVLVEAALTRYREKNEASNEKAKGSGKSKEGRTWEKYTSAFDLLAIILLAKGPGPTAQQAPSIDFEM